MLSIPPFQIVNIKKNKHSYLNIVSNTSEFTNTTKVQTVVEKNSSGQVVQSWQPKVSKISTNKNRCRVRLKADERMDRKVTDPDGGTLTVTLVLMTGGKDQPVAGPVEYVNDDET
jgi:hypothetical protein